MDYGDFITDNVIRWDIWLSSTGVRVTCFSAAGYQNDSSLSGDYGWPGSETVPALMVIVDAFCNKMEKRGILFSINLEKRPSALVPGKEVWSYRIVRL